MIAKAIARTFLRVNGWEIETGRPPYAKYVLIAAPHTSNWDLAYMLAMGVLLEIEISWMGKHTLFRGPLGYVMRALGGVPVQRDRRGDRVAGLAELFASRDRLVLVVPAEGTRGYTPHWKSGFYHIATRARVPIVMGYLDYARRRGGLGPALMTSGDVRADMDEIRAFYADKRGRHPDWFGEVRLKEED